MPEMEMGYQKLPEIPAANNSSRFVTADEINWLTYLRINRPDICVKYCTLILSGMRRYDANIDTGRVFLAAKGILAEMGGHPQCQ